tara:strand:+ start:2231 stop:2896 length:666 start_codon:yes stop_codon:yes gene_type:complete
MEYLTYQLLKINDADEVIDLIKSDLSSWEDGKKTAGKHAAKVKNNSQLNRSSNVAIKASEYISDKITKNHLIRSFCLIKKVHGILFSESNEGNGYGMHVDNAYMSSGRSDISFTLFLSKPEDYEGGELCIQSLQENKEIKLSAGEIIFYPSTSLHSVNKVSRGVRIVCVGWIESYISSQEDRSLLFGLDAGAKGLLSKHGQSPELDLIFQSYNNLLRRMGG